MELPEDRGLYVRFETRAVYNKARSEGERVRDKEGKLVVDIEPEGRPIFDDVTYIVIVAAGDKDSMPERPATFCGRPEELKDWEKMKCRAARQHDCDIHRFPRHYHDFKAGQTEQNIGMPLKEWAGITRGMVEELAYFKVYTVEQLASMSDSNGANFMSLREKAKAFLAASKDTKAAQEIQGQLEERDARIAAGEARTKALEAQIAQLVAAQSAGVHGQGDIGANQFGAAGQAQQPQGLAKKRGS